jgi:hypothetical protein
MPTPGGFARRLAAGCVLAAAVVLPGTAVLANGPSAPTSTTPSGSEPFPPAVPAGESSAGQSPVTSRGYTQGGPELRPDPPANASTAPGAGRAPKPPVPGAPTQQEWERLLDRLAPHGVRPVTDESGQVVLDSEHLLVLTGGADGLVELRSWGAEITAEERPDVYAVRSGGRVVAWYLMEHRPVLTVVPPPAVPSPGASSETSPGSPPATSPKVPGASPSAAPGVSPGAAPGASPSAAPGASPGASSGAAPGISPEPSTSESPAGPLITTRPPAPQPSLPRTGSNVRNPTLVALAGASILCAGGLLVRLSRPPRRR